MKEKNKVSNAAQNNVIQAKETVSAAQAAYEKSLKIRENRILLARILLLVILFQALQPALGRMGLVHRTQETKIPWK